MNSMELKNVMLRLDVVFYRCVATVNYFLLDNMVLTSVSVLFCFLGLCVS